MALRVAVAERRKDGQQRAIELRPGFRQAGAQVAQLFDGAGPAQPFNRQVDAGLIEQHAGENANERCSDPIQRIVATAPGPDARCPRRIRRARRGGRRRRPARPPFQGEGFRQERAQTNARPTDRSGTSTACASRWPRWPARYALRGGRPCAMGREKSCPGSGFRSGRRHPSRDAWHRGRPRCRSMA